MRRLRHMMIGLALVSPAALGMYAWGQTPPPTKLPDNYNPVPPQFRGQPTNPTWTGSGLTPASAPVSSTFRPIAAPPAGPVVESPRAPELTPPAPLPAPVVSPAPVTPAVPFKSAAAIAPASPMVVVEKHCPELVNAGTSLKYEIIVRNPGSAAVSGCRVEEELPAGTRFVASDPPADVSAERLVWSFGQFEAGGEKKIKVEVQPEGDGEYRSTALVTFSATASMRTNLVRPKLAVTMNGPEQAVAGDSLALAIQVNNPGTGPANNVVLRVKLPAGFSHPAGSYIEADLGTLPPGESKSIPLKVIAAAGGTQVTEVAATGDGGLEASARTQATVLQPMLQLKRGGPAKVMFKSEVIEEYELNNPGNAPAANVTVTEVLPVGLEFQGASDGATYDPVGRAVTWRLGVQAPGAARRIVLKAKATAVGEQTTRVVAAAERGVEAKTDGSVNVEGIPALALEVVDLEDPVEVGGDLIYEIRVVNQGSCPCTGIRIVCDVPDGLQAVEAAGPSAFHAEGAKVVFEPLVKLATKADGVFRVKVHCLQPGDYRFKVQMTCEQLSTPVNKEESSRVYKN